MSTLEDALPYGIELTGLTDGYELHKSVLAILRAKADTSVDKRFTSQQSAQRQALLEISAQLLIVRRNERFDAFVLSWAKARKLSIGDANVRRIEGNPPNPQREEGRPPAED